MTSVQRGPESRAIAGGVDFAVEWLEDEADAEPKGDHRAGADIRDARLSGDARGRIPLHMKPQKTGKITYVAHLPPAVAGAIYRPRG